MSKQFWCYVNLNHNAKNVWVSDLETDQTVSGCGPTKDGLGRIITHGRVTANKEARELANRWNYTVSVVD